MGKVLKIVAVVVAVAVVIFAPEISAALLAAVAIKSAIATALLTAAITIGVGLAVKSLGVMPKPSANQGVPSVFRQAIANSFIVYGLRRVGGLLVFFHSRKVGKDHFRYFVIACAGHRCQGVVEWMLNDDVVTVDSGTGAVTSGPYAGAAWLWFQRGLASETANATFVSECGGNWTTDHKGSGVAVIYAKFKMTDDVIEAGMPNITAVIEGRDEILDPRDASTGYTNNAALVFYDWLQIPREEGGFGAYADEIPDDDYISAQANVCDETVEGEPRYTLNGVIVTGAAPSEVRDSMIVDCAGSYTFSGGKHVMRVGYWVPVSVTFDEDDFAGPLQVSPFLASDAAANEIQGTYVEPTDGYQGAPFATQTTDPAPSDIRQMQLDLAFTTNKHQAERVARIMLNRAQCEKTVIAPLNIVGMRAKALDMVQLSTDRYGLSNYAFVAAGWGLSADWGVVLTLREENEEIYEAPAPVAPPSVPAIVVPDPLITQRELSTLIANSFTSPTTVLSATETAGTASVEVFEHDRVYPDGESVTIATQTVGGLLTDTPYYLYYDDDTRADTSPTIVATTDPNEAQGAIDRHSLGRIKTPVTASGIEYVGGGVIPTGAQLGVKLQ